MKKIFKYKLEVTDGFILVMPVGAEILSLQIQNDIPCLWALVNPDEQNINRYFRFYGTGHPFDSTYYQFIGTIQMKSGELVLHLFETNLHP